MKRIELPLQKSVRVTLKAGERILLSGRIYTARDMAHKRLVDMIDRREDLPVHLKDEILYYCGPTPPPPGRAIGSCGPTTSARMDGFTLPLLKLGLAGMIGKGRRSKDVRQAIKAFKAVYFIATGGAGALLSQKVDRMSVVAFRDLGAEAIYELRVKDFPVIVAIDTKGGDIYQMSP
ncbi:MAG: FumA C-terminus/TtdB family hydratase beta subunit [Candidatus Omnitrophota bacterium]